MSRGSQSLTGNSCKICGCQRSHQRIFSKNNKCEAHCKNFYLLWSRVEIMADEIKELIEGTDFNFKDAKVPRLRQPSRRLQALVGEMPEVNAVEYRAAEDLDKIVAEMKHRFEGNNQEVMLALADIVFSSSPTQGEY